MEHLSTSGAPNTISSLEIFEADIYEVLASLDPDKSPGPDGIKPAILKYCAVALTPPLHHLFVLSVQISILPTQRKIHSVFPVHKSGRQSNVSNYRPTSLLCTISKVLQKVILNETSEQVNSTISSNQYGFILGRCSVHKLLTFLSIITESLDRKITTDVVYLDTSKAFDSVSPHHLLHKLRIIGITGKTWYWIKSYLLDRYHYVSLDGQSSEYLPVKSGVPPGSILGPLLFLV